MALLQLAILLLVVIGGTIPVFTRDVASQPMAISLFGLLLALMFMIFQAPDVALSQIVVGAVALPLMVLLALAKIRRDARLLQKSEAHARQEDQ